MTRELTYEYRVWLDENSDEGTRAVHKSELHHKETRRDTYLLLALKPHLLPKVRGGQTFEIKDCVGKVDDLDVWKRSLSADFPLAPEQAEFVSEAFGFSVAVSDLSSAKAAKYALESRMSVHDVLKRRELFRVDGCQVEVTKVTSGRRTARTFALEGKVCDKVSDLVAQFRLNDFPNHHYGVWLSDDQSTDISAPLPAGG